MGGRQPLNDRLRQGPEVGEAVFRPLGDRRDGLGLFPDLLQSRSVAGQVEEEAEGQTVQLF